MSGGTLDLLYVGTLPPHEGGSAVVGELLLAGLAGRGHRVRAITPIASGARDPYESSDPGFEVARFTVPYQENSPDRPAGADYRAHEGAEVGRLLALATDARPPDAIVIGRESFAPHVAGPARARGIPTLLVVAGGTTVGVVNGTYPRDEAQPLLEQIRAAGVIVVSARHMRDALAGLGVPGAEVIPNPVDLERFGSAAHADEARRALGARDGEVLVTHVSNLKPLKRAIDLVDAAEIALRDDDRLRFAVVGDGLCREELEAACAARGLEGRFRFTGWLAEDRVTACLAASDLVVMPSAGEAQALVYLETQAAGRTLVASDIPAAREVVDDGETGLLFPVGDTGALAAMLLRAAGDPGLRERIGQAARRRVERHALPRVVAEYEAALERLAG